MSDDMLNEAEFVGEEVEQEIVEQPQEQEEAIVEEAPTSEEPHETKSNGYEKRIHKLTAQKYEQLDEINRLKAEKEALERSQISPVQTEQASPPISGAEMPNPDLQFDDPAEYQRQLTAYTLQAVRDEQARAESERIAQENARQQQEQTRQRQADFASKAEKLGVDTEKALQSAGILQQRGMNNRAAELVLDHPAAPAIFEHLANNPVAFEEINNIVNPYQLVDRINALSSQAVTRNISSAPEPTPTLSGLSAKEPDEFDKLCPGAEWA